MAKKSFLIPTVLAIAGVLGAANVQASVPSIPVQGTVISATAQTLAQNPLNSLKIENAASSATLAQNHYSHSSHSSHASHSSHYSSRY